MAVSVLTRFYFLDDGFFTFNLKYLFFVGLWPEDYLNRTQRIIYRVYEFFLHFLNIIFFIISGIGTYRIKKDIIVLLTNVDKMLVGYNFFFKTVVFVTNRHKLRSLIEEMESSGDIVTTQKKKLMAKYVVALTTLALGIVGAFSFLAMLEGEMALEAWMPFNPYEDKMKLILSTQITALTFVPFVLRGLAMQGLICSITMYLCDQLTDLQKTIRNLKYSENTAMETTRIFNGIVKKHVRLMGYIHGMNNIFKEYFLIQNLAVTVELCVNAVMISVVGVQQLTLLMTFLTYLMLALINAYIYCYLGNELIIRSQGIALAAYESSWTSWPVMMQKDLLTVIRVAQRPLSLSAGGLSLMSIQTFAESLYNGYSIFAVLNDAVS